MAGRSGGGGRAGRSRRAKRGGRLPKRGGAGASGCRRAVAILAAADAVNDDVLARVVFNSGVSGGGCGVHQRGGRRGDDLSGFRGLVLDLSYR